jgi:hypothetical protein
MYYRSLGFDVLDKGAPLNMALATGKDIWLTPQPDDTMFVRQSLRGRRPSLRPAGQGSCTIPPPVRVGRRRGLLGVWILAGVAAIAAIAALVLGHPIYLHGLQLHPVAVHSFFRLRRILTNGTVVAMALRRLGCIPLALTATRCRSP